MRFEDQIYYKVMEKIARGQANPTDDGMSGVSRRNLEDTAMAGRSADAKAPTSIAANNAAQNEEAYANLARNAGVDHAEQLKGWAGKKTQELANTMEYLRRSAQLNAQRAGEKVLNAGSAIASGASSLKDKLLSAFDLSGAMAQHAAANAPNPSGVLTPEQLADANLQLAASDTLNAAAHPYGGWLERMGLDNLRSAPETVPGAVPLGEATSVPIASITHENVGDAAAKLLGNATVAPIGSITHMTAGAPQDAGWLGRMGVNTGEYLRAAEGHEGVGGALGAALQNPGKGALAGLAALLGGGGAALAHGDPAAEASSFAHMLPDMGGHGGTAIGGLLALLGGGAALKSSQNAATARAQAAEIAKKLQAANAAKSSTESALRAAQKTITSGGLLSRTLGKYGL